MSTLTTDYNKHMRKWIEVEIAIAALLTQAIFPVQTRIGDTLTAEYSKAGGIYSLRLRRRGGYPTESAQAATLTAIEAHGIMEFNVSKRLEPPLTGDTYSIVWSWRA